MPWVGVQCTIVVFPYHTQFLKAKVKVTYTKKGEYDQEIPQSQTADKHMALGERTTKPSRDKICLMGYKVSNYSFFF